MFSGDGLETLVDIACHSLGVAATSISLVLTNAKARRRAEHPMLHIYLFVSSRENARSSFVSRYRANARARLYIGSQSRSAGCRKQPACSRDHGGSFVQESPKRCDAGARPDHNDRRAWILGQPKFRRGLQIDATPCPEATAHRENWKQRHAASGPAFRTAQHPRSDALRWDAPAGKMK